MLRPIRRRATLLALLVLPLVALNACDDSPTDTGSDDVRGVWVGQDGNATVYLDISSSEVGTYIGSHSSCFVHVEYEIVDTSGDSYTLSLPGSTFTAELIIRRSGDRLEVRDPDDQNTVAFYNSANDDVSELELCMGGGADPDIVCTELPPIDVGESVTGSLSTTDATTDFGTYFDLYSLQLTTSQQVTIDLESTDFDSYLGVYDAEGGVIAENDDAVEGSIDASLTLELEPGCYRIEATSYNFEETGTYTLSVD